MTACSPNRLNTFEVRIVRNKTRTHNVVREVRTAYKQTNGVGGNAKTGQRLCDLCGTEYAVANYFILSTRIPVFSGTNEW